MEDVYFRLQKQYREAQAGLNAMKHECMKAIEESTVAAKAEYSKAIADWTNDRKLLEARHSEYIQRKVKDISGLRISIPDSLQKIYGEVSNLGKK